MRLITVLQSVLCRTRIGMEKRVQSSFSDRGSWNSNGDFLIVLRTTILNSQIFILGSAIGHAVSLVTEDLYKSQNGGSCVGRVDFEIDEFLDVDVLGLIFKDRGVAFVDVVQAADVDFLCACHLSVIDVRGSSRIRKKGHTSNPANFQYCAIVCIIFVFALTLAMARSFTVGFKHHIKGIWIAQPL